ncbi:MAG: c-type cytochrome [Balneolales bacterium]
MKNPRILFSSAILIVLAVLAAFWFNRGGADEAIVDCRMSLSTSIAQSPGTDLEETDYEAYADLKVPPLHPDEALEKFELEEGFRIEIVAHEPMITDPVAMDIDADGRLWVVDMPSYMPVVDMGDWETAAREQVPQGRVVVLEDTNGDGKMDKHRVFFEGLILPRAIKVLNDGVLIGEPPNVWHIRDTTGDGKGDSRELVYENYGDPNVINVESLTNGLVWGMDNWLHSANDGVESIRRIDGQWQTRPFQRLGQWGMTQDNWGRLYSANNTRPLQTHLVPYGYSDRHPLFDVSTGKNFSISPSEPMWPAHAVGSNRSYQVGEEVREDGTLKRATSTLGPVIYRGDQFGEEYRNNAFTPEAAANMIKRIIIDGDPDQIDATARFAYEGREFLTSTDERFRPVNMYNSPDGSLYVLDMYRGLIQHARFLTDHLRDYAVERGLHIPTGKFGRIYRIVREDRNIDYNTPKFSELDPQEVVNYLSHKNGLLRDQAQQLLVQCSPEGVVPALEGLIRDESAEPYTRLQALWTLEGFERSTYSGEQLTDIALKSLDDQHSRVQAAAIRILEPAIAQNSGNVLNRLGQMVEEEATPFVQLQLLASLGESSDDSVLSLMARILHENSESAYFREMALTGTYQREGKMAEILRTEYDWSEEQSDDAEWVLTRLAEAQIEQPEVDHSHMTEFQRELFERGSQLYATCRSCHGAEGQGVSGIGPALAGSEWVQEDPDALARIVLHGFKGGVAERPRQAVNVAGTMPAHGFMPDEDLAAIMTFIRQSWDNDALPIEPAEVARIREEAGDRSEEWSPDELRELLE